MNGYFYNLGVYFSAVSDQNSQSPALRYLNKTMSYRDLELAVQKLANTLISYGLKQGQVVAIGNNKHPLSFALMLAALRLGVAYVNIDTASPLSRNAKILGTVRPKLLFFDDNNYVSDMKALGEMVHCPVIRLNEDLIAEQSGDTEAQFSRMKLVDSATIAYIMFTSGSTGVPKGVAVTHQNLLHFIAWGRARFEITPLDIFTNVSPIYFDNSVFDFYIGLFSGASLFPVDRDLLSTPYELVTQVSKMSCTIWFSVPSLLIYLIAMKAIRPKTLNDLRTVMFGGEGYPKSELKKLYELFNSHATLVNVYGPTECTCICSAYDICDGDFVQMHGLPPLGQLNENFDFLILNDQDQEDSSGELCLIGPNVASGYFSNNELTERSFVSLEQPERYGKRMYRTGDLVRIEKGLLYFQGRKDFQIKHMGYRIELEEIEHAIMQVKGVIQAVAIYHRSHVAYGKIIGFVSTTSSLTEGDILETINALIPNYMIPSKFILLDHFPKNANGKIDREALMESL